MPGESVKAVENSLFMITMRKASVVRGKRTIKKHKKMAGMIPFPTARFCVWIVIKKQIPTEAMNNPYEKQAGTANRDAVPAYLFYSFPVSLLIGGITIFVQMISFGKIRKIFSAPISSYTVFTVALFLCIPVIAVIKPGIAF